LNVKKFFFWFFAILITLSSAVYQRITGPTYPVHGKVILGDAEIRYRLLRSHEITSDCEIDIKAASPEVSGRVLYQRFKTTDPWTEIPFSRQGDKLVANLPKQPMAGKLAYKVHLSFHRKEVSLTGEEPAVLRFKGEVPLAVLICHVLVMFLAMLFSTCAGIAALIRRPSARKFALWTAALLFVGGFILGPLVQKFAFGAWWTGFPLGFDLTDNKTLIAMLGWVAALIAGRGGKPARAWIIVASVLMLVVFMIPHSLFGSELKYTDLKQ
jgi:hypothetical protein